MKTAKIKKGVKGNNSITNVKKGLSSKKEKRGGKKLAGKNWRELGTKFEYRKVEIKLSPKINGKKKRR